MITSEAYTLPAKLDLNAASGLARNLLAKRGAALSLDASQVTHIGTPGLQVLISARKTWEADHKPLILTGFGAALIEQLSPMGLTAADLVTQECGAASDVEAHAPLASGNGETDRAIGGEASTPDDPLPGGAGPVGATDPNDPLDES